MLRLQVFFAATGVSDGDLVRGVRFFSGGATTNSVVMRGKSQTVRYIETFHKWAGSAANPVSPWHQQGAFPMVQHNRNSMAGSPVEQQYLMDD